MRASDARRSAGRSVTSQPPIFGERRPDVAYCRREGAYAVILDGGRLFVVEAPVGLYLPGGGLEGGEDIAAGLRREVLEETGYELIEATPIGLAHQLLIVRSSGAGIEKAEHFFSARLAARPRLAPSETVAWLAAETAAGAMTEEAQAWAVHRALDMRRG